MNAKRFEYPNDYKSLVDIIVARAGTKSKSSQLDASIEEYKQHLLQLAQFVGNSYYPEVRTRITKLRSTIYGNPGKLLKKTER